MARALPLALALLAVAAPASAEPEPRTLLVAYTTFQSPGPERIPQGSSFESAVRYLERIGERSRTDDRFDRPVAFDLVLGNYYQVYAWLKYGHVDAAVVSPFVASLIDDDYYLPVVDLVEDTRGDSGQYPTVRRGDGREGGASAYVEHLDALWCQATDDEECGEGYTLELVAHLSSSAFVAPVVRAAEWLAEKLPQPDEERAFWERFWASVEFSFGHGCSSADAGRLCFSYSGAGPRPGTERLFEFEIPHDTLLVRRDLALRLARSGERFARNPELRAMWLVEPPGVVAGGTGGGYREVRPYLADAHDDFVERVRRAFDRSPELSALRALWFGAGKFHFTLDELLALLWQDQASSDERHLAVVLPGGGVKAAYQAQLLDALYSDQRLVNPGPGYRDCGGARARGDPLCVDAIVGTSGGAMTGVFAALRSGAAGRSLASLWVEGDEIRISSARLFNSLDILRWGSMLLTFLIFCAGLQMAYASARGMTQFGDEIPLERGWPNLPFGLLVVAVAIAGPIGVKYLKGFGLYEEVFSVEGGLYALLLVVCHGVLSCTKQAPDGARTLRLVRFSPLVAVAALAALVGPFAFRRWVGRDLESTITFNAGLLLAVCALYLWNYNRTGERAVRVGAYLRALALPLGLAIGAQAVVFAASLTGRVSMLELTLPYWLTLLGASVALSAAVALWALYAPRGWVYRQAEFWLQRHGVLFVRSRRMWSIASFLVLGIFWWNLWLAPGLYGNKDAIGTFEATLLEFAGARDAEGRPEVPRAFDLQTRLVVSAASIDDPKDLYFCFEAGGGCAREGAPMAGPLLLSEEPVGEAVLHVVFASGAAFPIFPAHRVPEGVLDSYPDGIFLVDGGYGSNVPLEAAALTGARQVLVIHSTPDPELTKEPSPSEWRFSGELARYVLQLWPLLFEKAQEGDTRVRHELVVAEIHPDPGHGAFPFLADFRETTVRRMVDAALADLERNRRIGQLRDWGLPGRRVLRVPRQPQ